MLTEHEKLADHEARISRQELPPLQQPLDNIEEIRQSLNHEWQPFETAPEGVPLLWYLPFAQPGFKYTVETKSRLNGLYWQPHICEWQHLPSPPEKSDV